MSIEKSEIRLAAVCELGVRLDDILEATRKEASHQVGAVAAYKVATQTLTALVSQVDTDIQGGLLTLDEGAKAKSYLVKAIAVVDSLGQQSTTQSILFAGKAQGLEAAVMAAKQASDMEKARITALGNPEPDAATKTGSGLGRPPCTIKELRQAGAPTIPTANSVGSEVLAKQGPAKTSAQKAAAARVRKGTHVTNTK